MKLLKIELLILSLFVCLSCFAQEVADEEEALDITLQDPFLSIKYQRGEYLVYDCVDKHWVCTGKPEFNNCNEARDIAQYENRNKLPCASVKGFSSEDECNKIQKRLTSSGYDVRFCKSSELRELEKVF
ncbi:MAG: hypothetical protein CME62_18285 [Halobacteriovoraceae bacterium]|nr:hypothetical protein [Halobacteriovoraceae bacterium]|tara:strand:- start:8825 stop:9211 length:387 start_codon:yes stop_codon:yes gene_type:complete